MKAEQTGGSLKVASVAGIGIFLHWTFAALIAWLAISGIIAGKSFSQIAGTFAFIAALFACVVLHELGHALAARKFGIKTRDIILLPIGGVARLERIPEKPAQELWVAIAGPIVNVVIAAVVFPVIALQGADASFTSGFLPRLLWVNLFMAVFNLLPAFPMDGGRILRALLSMRLGRARATSLAVKIGKGMAVLFGLVGFFSNPFLIFIAIFVYFGAEAEGRMVQTTSLIQGLQVKDAMMTRYRSLAPGDNLAKAVSELLAGSQEEFPVMDNSTVLGILRRQDIIKGLADRGQETAVSELASGQCVGVQADASLERTLESMRLEGCRTLPVFQGGNMVGLLTMENISEFIMVRAALRGAPAP